MPRLTMLLTGKSADQALQMIESQKGLILTVTPLASGGETIWYQLPNGNYCTIGTNPIPSYSGVYGGFGVALEKHLNALTEAGVTLSGFQVDEPVGIGT